MNQLGERITRNMQLFYIHCYKTVLFVNFINSGLNMLVIIYPTNLFSLMDGHQVCFLNLDIDVLVIFHLKRVKNH